MTLGVLAYLSGQPAWAQTAKPAPKRMLLVARPIAEVRSDNGFYCVTPCFIDISRAGKRLTFSKDDYRDVVLNLPFPRTPEGGAWDIAQNAQIEFARDFILIDLGSREVNLNDNMPSPR